jgi:uncharacterized phiE125 gp8 family phage protein
MYRPGQHILKRVVAPTASPVRLDDMKAHLRATYSDEDDLIQSYIDAAVSMLDAQGELGQAIMPQTWDESFSTAARDVELSIRPSISLVSVKYYDTENVLQTATIGDFALYSSDFWAFVRSENWPQVYDRPDAITVQYVAGAGLPPESLVHAIKLTVGHWYEARADASEVKLSDIPRGATHLINLLRGGWYG